MKIICESCGAKYSIADEKVAGKVFKIRCKKCSEVIVVRGDQPQETEDTRVFDYGSDAIWHVVVDGEQQGPLTPTQVGDLLADGRIDWEAYVWCEGLDNWQPAKDVEALVSAVMADAEGGDAQAAAPAAAVAATPAVTPAVAMDEPAVSVAADYAAAAEAQSSFGGDMGADPFGGDDDGGLSGLVDQPVASASAAGGAADLFAGVGGGDDFSGGEPEPEVEVAASAASPRVDASEAMTGARNENSVLFSLSNLQALATSSGSSAPAAGPSERPGMAQGEGSGLIDIRALASASQTVKESQAAQTGSADQVESLLAVGGGGSTFGAAAIAAPVAAEKPEGGNKLIYGLVAALGVVVLALGGVVMAMFMKDDPAPVAANTATPEPPAAAATAAALPAAAEAAKPAAAEEPAEEEAEPAEEEAAAEDEADDSADEEEDDDSGSSSDRRRERKKRRSSSSRSASPSKAAPDPEPAKSEPAPAPAPKPARKSNSNSSIDDLLSGALGGKKAASKPSRSASGGSSSNLPDSPDRNSVKNALQSVSGAVASCGQGQSGVAMTKITVAGSTGRVTNAVVTGQFAGTPVGSCVAKKVRGARFPKFKQKTFSVSYPYRL